MRDLEEKVAYGFGRSLKLLNEATGKVTPNDVAGVEEQGRRRDSRIFKNPKKFSNSVERFLWALIVEFQDLAKLFSAIVEKQMFLFSISGSDFVEMFVGVGASRVRDMFDQGKKFALHNIYLRVDAVEEAGAELGSKWWKRTNFKSIISRMDGFDTNEGIIYLGNK